MTKIINNISAILNEYSLFIIDIAGVVHNDGEKALPGVLEILEKIKSLGKKVVFLSNAPRRINEIIGVFEKIGITSNLYDRIHTSGEETRALLQSNEFTHGTKCYLIGSDQQLLEETNISTVDNIDEADFIFGFGFLKNIHGVLERKNLEIYHEIIDEALKRNLTWLCPNPDIIVKTINGELYCPGAVAEIYKQKGGNVIYAGKPYKPAYERIFSWYKEIPQNEIIAIGDGLNTDIKGAFNSGISSVLIVESGIHCNSILNLETRIIDENKLQEFCSSYNLFPTYATNFFK